MTLLLLLACVADRPFEVYREADPTRTGELGADGPWGAAWANRRWPARIVDRVDVEVMLPVDADGALALPDPPTVVLVQGGDVQVPRYRWLAVHFATRGYAVLSPHHTADRAIFNLGNAQAALIEAEADAEIGPWVRDEAVVAGHSLGGVVGVKNWMVDERVLGVILLGSYPAGGDDVAERAGSPVLSISGTEDGYSTPADVAAGFARFAEPRWLAMVDDLNHFGWTDAAEPDELAEDGTTTDLWGDRTRALHVIDTFLDAALTDDPDAWARLDEPFDGVEVTR